MEDRLSNINRQTFDRVAVGVINIVLQVFGVVWLIFNFSWLALVVLIVLSVTTGAMPAIFAHRAWSHKSWYPNKYLNRFGLFMHTQSLVGSSIAYVAIHREHHKHTDEIGDPHSPYLRSRLSIQLFNAFSKVKVNWMKTTVDLLRDPDHIWFAKYYWHVNILFYGCLYLITPTYFPMIIALKGIGTLKGHTSNSLLHRPPMWILPIKFSGHGPGNSFVHNVITIGQGESWHANHHNDPSNWRLGHKWYETDIGALWIRVFVYLGWASLPQRRDNV